MNKYNSRLTVTFFIIVAGTLQLAGQSTLPDVLNIGTLTDQMNFIETKTRIYEDYRAIREDMFQKLKINAIDSLAKAKTDINSLFEITRKLNSSIDSLKGNLKSSNDQVKDLTKTKNSISILGIELNKTSYNSIMWMIMAVLLVLLGIGFLAFKRNLIVSTATKKELTDLKAEFEAYRQKTRIEREKVSMEHFNEIKKLKGR